MVKRTRPKTQKELAYQARRKAEAKQALDAWIKRELEKAPPLTLERWLEIQKIIERNNWNALVRRFYHTPTKPPKLAQGRLKS